MKLRGEGTNLDCGGFFFHASKVRKSTDFGPFRQHAWTDEAHMVGPRVSLHLSRLQIAPWLLPSMPPSGRDGKLGFGAKSWKPSNFSGSSQAARKGANAAFAVHGIFRVLFMFPFWYFFACGNVGSHLEQKRRLRSFIIKAKECYN